MLWHVKFYCVSEDVENDLYCCSSDSNILFISLFISFYLFVYFIVIFASLFWSLEHDIIFIRYVYYTHGELRKRERNAHHRRSGRGSGTLGLTSNNNLAFPFFSLTSRVLAGVLLDLIRSRNFAVRRTSLITPAVHRDSRLPSIRVSLLYVSLSFNSPSSTMCPCHGKCTGFGKIASYLCMQRLVMCIRDLMRNIRRWWKLCSNFASKINSFEISIIYSVLEFNKKYLCY